MGRVGKVEEIASVVAFLAPEGASCITSETLHVTGGFR
jgi:3-oxoacyl-[acyl-carrier protein] reductase